MVFRKLVVRMTFEQRKACFAAMDKAKADKLRSGIVKRYKLNINVEDKVIIEIGKYEKEKRECEGCDGVKCRKKFDNEYQEAFLEKTDEGEFKLEHRSCALHRQYVRQLKLEKNFSSAKIPKLYRGKTFEDYIETAGNKKAIKRAKQILEDGEVGLLLVGKCGCGKTMLAAIVATESIKKNRNVLFATVPRLLNDIKSTYSEKSNESTLGVLKTIESVDVLVLDDLGTEKASEWVSEILFSIINERYHERRQTIITSNYSAKELEEHIGGETGRRIVSRICSMCEYVYIEEEDWRTK